MLVPGPRGAPVHDRVVQQHEAIGRAELEGALLVADDLVPDDVPGAARLRLKADAVVHGVVDAVAPHPHVRAPVVGLDPIVGRVEDVVAEDVDVDVGIGDPVGDVGDPVVGDGVAARDVQVDPFAVEALGRRGRVATNRVVGDVPVRARALQVDAVVIVRRRCSA